MSNKKQKQIRDEWARRNWKKQEQRVLLSRSDLSKPMWKGKYDERLVSNSSKLGSKCGLVEIILLDTENKNNKNK